MTRDQKGMEGVNTNYYCVPLKLIGLIKTMNNIKEEMILFTDCSNYEK